MNRAHLILAILAAALVAGVVGGARAESRFEVMGGHCEQNRTAEGSWWNSHYETNLDLSTACYQLGISNTPWAWRGTSFGWRVAYVDLGRISTNSVMAIRDEDQFQNPSGANCNLATGAGCLIRTVGGGTARGISFGLLVERDRGGPVLGAEAGLFVYHNRFAIHITNYPDPSVSTAAMVNQDHVTTNGRETDWDRADGWLATPYIGVNLRYQWFMVAARRYSSIMAKGECGGCSGVTKHDAFQINAGISIPF